MFPGLGKVLFSTVLFDMLSDARAIRPDASL